MFNEMMPMSNIGSSGKYKVFNKKGLTDRHVACGFKPKYILVTVPDTSCIVYNAVFNPTKFYQFTYSGQATGWYNVAPNVTIESIDDVGSQDNPEGGFTMSAAAWTAVTSDTAFIAIEDVESV